MTELLGEAIVEAARRYKTRVSRRTREVIEWLREMAEPPAGVELRSSDGSCYSGVALFERNDIKLMLAVRHPPGKAPSPPPRVVTPPPSPRARSIYDMIDPDDPRWDRDVGPYGR